MTKKFLALISLVALLQLIVIGTVGLAHDEAYYWLYSLDLSWGYFDHPPFVAWIIKLFSFLPHHEFSLRIGFVLLQFLGLGALLQVIDRKDWIRASLLYFSFPLVSFASLFALPDLPLVFMSALFIWVLHEYLKKETLIKAMTLGLVIALLCYAKYHGILLVFFTVLALPRLALKKEFYVAAIVAIICLIPHLLWQIDHDFSTFRYHFLERPKASFSFPRSLEFVGLQIVLAGVFAGFIVWWEAVRAAPSNFNRVLKFISFGSVLFFLISSFSKRVEANWTIYLAVSLIPLVASSEIWNKVWAKRVLIVSFVLVLVLRLIFFFPSIAPKRINEFKGWKEWALEVEGICQELPVVANTYQVASKLSFYLNKKVHSLNYRSRKNQFDYYGFERNYPEGPVCYLTDKDFTGEEILTPEKKRLKVVKDFSMAELLVKKKIWEDNKE
ncbi:MAG TPA: glycosyltransferase family 39 protein [Bacteriovoracaceae bacterium]|nr:glycosyltransferase family 39 protein [Bacteriovoracaceae bacterium]